MKNLICNTVDLIAGECTCAGMKFVLCRKALFFGASLFLVVLFFAGCSSDQSPTSNSGNNRPAAQADASPKPAATSGASSPSTTATASITASPNPVPAGKDFGTTKIGWDTGDGSWGQVYVSTNGEPETLFMQGDKGSSDAPWIGTGGVYEFRLYAGQEHKKLLATVKVTRNEK